MNNFKLLIVLIYILSSCSTSQEQNQVIETIDNIDNVEVLEEELSAEVYDSIVVLISYFKEKNIDKIAQKVSYPLERANPITPINNRAEFKKRFYEVFDDKFIAKIVNSNKNDWSEVGWRGVMFNNGDLWIANSDGVITSVNYQSDFEKKLEQELYSIQNQNLHSSLHNFKENIYLFTTQSFYIRIDRLKDDQFRYASWKIDSNQLTKPELVLLNGIYDSEGSGGNHTISFKNNKYTYLIHRNILGNENTPPITIEILKNNEIILNQNGTFVVD